MDRRYSLRAPTGRTWYFSEFSGARREDGRPVLLRFIQGLPPLDPAIWEQHLSPLRALELSGTTTLLDLGRWGDNLVMVYAPPAGVRLDELLRAGRLSLKQSLCLGRAVARSVQEAHRRGVLHRHICPPMLFADLPALDCAVSGWGVVQTPGWLRRHTPTPLLSYLSPEELRGESVDGRADLFSLGVLLTTLITGESPEEPADAEAALQAAEQGLLRSPQEEAIGEVHAPHALVWAVRRCLSPSPAERFSHAAELVRVLDVTLSAMRQEEREVQRPLSRPRAEEEPTDPTPLSLEPEYIAASPIPERPAPSLRPWLVIALVLALILSWASRLDIQLLPGSRGVLSRPLPRLTPSQTATDPALEALLRPSQRDDLALFTGESTPIQSPTRSGPSAPSPPAARTTSPAATPAPQAAPPEPEPEAVPAAEAPRKAPPHRSGGLRKDPWPEEH